MANKTLYQHQRDIVEWANAVFPHRTPKDVLLKFYEELGEVIKKPTDPMEYADVMILLLDFANFNDIDGEVIMKAIGEKMEVNKLRRWVIDRRTGIMQHA